ncbi:MAG: S8 family serine peptidase [Thermoplasmatota archaeon]
MALRSKFPRALALALAAAFLAAGAATSVAATRTDTTTTYLVGAPAGLAGLVAASHGATLVADLPDLGLAVMKAGDAVARDLAADPRVSFVEKDGLVGGEGAQWDSATWDSASWSSAAWNSAAWDTASWTSAGWDSASWATSSWNSASWNTAGWDTAAWNSASWDTSSWNSASWDVASWNTAAWDTASWNTASWNVASWDTASWNTASWDSQWGKSLAPPWGLFAIQAPEAWATGVPVHNIDVCIVDSGIDANHPALQSNLWHAADGSVGWNAITGTNDPTDDAGHGTAMAGIVAATPGNGLGFAGVAAPLVMSVKVLSAQGIGTTSNVIEGIDWCVTHHANVMLLALSEDTPTNAFKHAIAAANEAGLLIVASAGNNGPCMKCISSPASYDKVLSVGAIDPARHVALFSSLGPQLDILAPGVQIVSAWPHDSARVGSGTSQAAAFAAGAAALVWAKDPTMSAEKVQSLLLKSAQPFGKPGKDKDSGYGVLDVAAAISAMSHGDHANDSSS